VKGSNQEVKKVGVVRKMISFFYSFSNPQVFNKGGVEKSPLDLRFLHLPTENHPGYYDYLYLYKG